MLPSRAPCLVSPIVSDLDSSQRFYRDLLELEVSSAPAAGYLPWDTARRAP
jgi:catechol 2,3-dioxygenase-like lactoylglutathione lyase family enzyme